MAAGDSSAEPEPLGALDMGQGGPAAVPQTRARGALEACGLFKRSIRSGPKG